LEVGDGESVLVEVAFDEFSAFLGVGMGFEVVESEEEQLGLFVGERAEVVDLDVGVSEFFEDAESQVSVDDLEAAGVGVEFFGSSQGSDDERWVEAGGSDVCGEFPEDGFGGVGAGVGVGQELGDGGLHGRSFCLKKWSEKMVVRGLFGGGEGAAFPGQIASSRTSRNDGNKGLLAMTEKRGLFAKAEMRVLWG